jgi:O-antigen/teichoic acid export membrane protein
MRDGRLRRFLGGLGLGYVQTAATILVGLWVTPFLLRRLGSNDYGLWLVGTQVLTYLALLDVGIVALVPREIAAAAGRAGADRAQLQSLVGETASLVLWQLPAVALAGALIVWLMPSEWTALRWPLAMVVLTFVVVFPLRLFAAILQGLQELTFLGGVQIAAWAAGAAMTVFGAWRGWGLTALALGWITTQLLSAAFAWWRLAMAFPEVIPKRLPALSARSAGRQLSRGAWISMNQISQVLLVGTDLVVVGKLLGPAAVVPYACTGRLATMLANQPQMFMQMALPALSELRTAATRERLFEVSRSMAHVMLFLSGGIVVVVMAINRPFVTWWVGESSFAGMSLTGIVLTGMLLRHLNATATYTLFCFGNERRLALTSIADGLVSLIAMLVLVPSFGLYGAAIGSLAGTSLVSLPNNFSALAREERTSPLSFLAPRLPWLGRLVVVLLATFGVTSMWKAQGLSNMMLLGAAVSALYVALMVPVLTAPPLGPMLRARIRPFIAVLPGFMRRGFGLVPIESAISTE